MGGDERLCVVVSGDPGVHPLRRVRRRRGMSLGTLGGLVGLSPSFLSRIENGKLELRRKSDVLALAAALRVAPVELIPWVLSGSGTWPGSAVLSVVPAVHADAGSCTAEATRDLLDCNCGSVTHAMKVQILHMWDAHAEHTRQSGHASRQGTGG